MIIEVDFKEENVTLLCDEYSDIWFI